METIQVLQHTMDIAINVGLWLGLLTAWFFPQKLDILWLTENNTLDWPNLLEGAKLARIEARSRLSMSKNPYNKRFFAHINFF